MKVFAILGSLAVAMMALTILVVMMASEVTFLAIFIAILLSGAMFRLVIARIAPHWSGARAMLVAAAIFPALFWLVVFGFEAYSAIYHNLFAPDEPFMGGLSIMLFPVCLIGFPFGFLAALVASSFAKPDSQR